MAKLTEEETLDVILHDEKFINKFWSYVDKSAGEDNCWIWIGKKRKSVVNKKKYGQIRIPGSDPMDVHRISLTMKLGYFPLADSLHSPEICKGNKKCVNPNHLRDGSESENRRDENIAGNTIRQRKTRFKKLIEASSKAERKYFYDILREEFPG